MRRALEICRRASEIAEAKDPNGLVSADDIVRTNKDLFGSTIVQTIQQGSEFQRMLLLALMLEMRRSGSSEVNKRHPACVMPQLAGGNRDCKSSILGSSQFESRCRSVRRYAPTNNGSCAEDLLSAEGSTFDRIRVQRIQGQSDATKL